MSASYYVLIAILAGVANAQPRDGVTDACMLVTKADVESILSRSVPEPRSQQRQGVATCAYVDTPRKIIAVIDVFTFANQAEAREVLTLSGCNPRVRSVNGVGDDAVWNPDTKTLAVLTGNYLLGIRGVAGLDAAKKLAAAALARLP